MLCFGNESGKEFQIGFWRFLDLCWESRRDTTHWSLKHAVSMRIHATPLFCVKTVSPGSTPGKVSFLEFFRLSRHMMNTRLAVCFEPLRIQNMDRG